jgi:tyrosyl-tRNA synthetase
MPLLTGIDGERKMSKSYGNHIGVADAPQEIYGRTLSIPDAALGDWYALLLGTAPDPAQAPRDVKRALARALVERFYDAAAAQAAEAAFDRVFVRGQIPADVPVVRWTLNGSGTVHLPALLAQAFSVSTSEARRGLQQGAVRLDGAPVAGDVLDVPAGDLHGRVLQLGKRRFARVEIVE